jgi:hypothetical protein
MRTVISILAFAAIMVACNNETKTETNRTDTSAVNTVDSLKGVMKDVDDSSKRARDSAALRK